MTLLEFSDECAEKTDQTFDFPELFFGSNIYQVLHSDGRVIPILSGYITDNGRNIRILRCMRKDGFIYELKQEI